jgi:hypothetical protein
MSTSSRPLRPDRPLGRFIPNPKLRFLDQCREVLRFKQMALRTEESYVDWIRRFIVWSGKRHPREMGAKENELIRICAKSIQTSQERSLRRSKLSVER